MIKHNILEYSLSPKIIVSDCGSVLHPKMIRESSKYFGPDLVAQRAIWAELSEEEMKASNVRTSVSLLLLPFC